MASNYGFTVKTKVSAGPQIKYFVGRFADDEGAAAFASLLNDELANNAKLGVRKILVNPQESDFEVQEGQDLVDEVVALYRLDSYDNEANLIGQAYLTIPSLTPRNAQDLPAFLVQESGLMIKGNGGIDVPVTNASLVRMTYYVV